MGCSPIRDGKPYRTLTNMGYSPIWDAHSYGIFTHNESSPIWDIHQYWYSPIRTFSSMDVHPYRTFIHTDVFPYATLTHMVCSNIWEITQMVVHTCGTFTHTWCSPICDVQPYRTFSNTGHLIWNCKLFSYYGWSHLKSGLPSLFSEEGSLSNRVRNKVPSKKENLMCSPVLLRYTLTILIPL